MERPGQLGRTDRARRAKERARTLKIGVADMNSVTAAPAVTPHPVRAGSQFITFLWEREPDDGGGGGRKPRSARVSAPSPDELSRTGQERGSS